MLIEDLETLRETVKISASGDWKAIAPFVLDAERFYLSRYLGQKLITRLEQKQDTDKDLLKNVQRVLGPLSYMLATHESSIGFGDAGHTVKRTDSLAPASDTKVDKAHDSAKFRGWENLEYLLSYLEENQEDYPEWESSLYRKNLTCKYFRSAHDFQTFGMLDIAYSRLTFEKLIQLIRRIETTEINKLVEIDIDPFVDNLPGDKQDLVAAIQPYIAARVASLHTSQTTRVQRTEAGRPEYKAVIRPLYSDLEDTGNYFQEQTDYWKAEIINILEEMGIDKSGAMKWNNEEKKIFYNFG